ncbi:MAG: hypothetical protein ABJB74_11680 [Gemmatimonas sp.]
MNKRITAIVGAAVLLVPLVWAVACNDKDNVTEPTVPAGVAELRASLAPYSSLALAKAAGYNTAITDCMSNGDIGSMGVHWANTTLVDATADALHPEALIYEPGTDGQASLVGVEFIVPFALVPKTSPAPVLFGQKFEVNDVFGVWALHVWTHRTNPAGTFATWNARVHC